MDTWSSWLTGVQRAPTLPAPSRAQCFQDTQPFPPIQGFPARQRLLWLQDIRGLAWRHRTPGSPSPEPGQPQASPLPAINNSRSREPSAAGTRILCCPGTSAASMACGGTASLLDGWQTAYGISALQEISKNTPHPPPGQRASGHAGTLLQGRGRGWPDVEEGALLLWMQLCPLPCNRPPPSHRPQPRGRRGDQGLRESSLASSPDSVCFLFSFLAEETEMGPIFLWD